MKILGALALAATLGCRGLPPSETIRHGDADHGGVRETSPESVLADAPPLEPSGGDIDPDAQGADAAPAPRPCAEAEVEPGFPAAAPDGAEEARPGLGGSAVVRAAAVEVVPPGGGSAHRVVSGAGAVEGGHLSGDSPPFVHVAHGRVGMDCTAALRSSAEALVASLDAGTLEPGPPAAPGQVALRLELLDGRNLTVRWPFGADPSDPLVRELYRALAEIPCGGW